MSQQSFGFGDPNQGLEIWREELEWLKRAVAAITPKEVAWALKITDSTLSDALSERKHGDGKKRMPGEWISVIRSMAPFGLQQEYLTIIGRPLGFEEPQRRKVRTPEERLDELKRLVAKKFGELGEQLVEEACR